MINKLIQQMYELAGTQKGQLAQELLDFTGSIPTYGKQVADNTKLLDKCLQLNQTLIGNIKTMVSKRLRFANGDYYIFIQKGGKLTVSISPSGRAKAVDFILKDKGVRVTLTIGTVKDGDIVSLKTNGSIQVIEVESNQQSIFNRNARVTGCYGVVSIFSKKTDSLMAQNVIIVDSVEYTAIKAMASKTMQTYESMFINKVILRRYASLLPAYIGGGFSDDEIDTLGEIRKSRVDINEENGDEILINDKKEDDKKTIVSTIHNLYRNSFKELQGEDGKSIKEQTKVSEKITTLVEKAKEGKVDENGVPINSISLLPLETLKQLLKEVQNVTDNR